MKKLILLLMVSTIAFIGCDTKNKELEDKYNALVEENDSIVMHHQKFEKTHQEMVAAHQRYTEELKDMEIQDSTLLEDMAKHEVILKRHDAIIKSHSDIIEGHKQLKADFDAMSDPEKEAEIEAMRQDHDKIKEEHSTMEKEHEVLMEEHQNIQKRKEQDMDKDDTME